MSSRIARQPLNRDRVLGAAVEIADRYGLTALTMRRLGQQLGVEAMSIYKHLAGKDAILDGIVELVIGEIQLPTPGTDWKTAMRLRAISAREVLARHPWAVGLMESRARAGPATLRYIDAVIGSLLSGGFGTDLAARAFLMLDSYVYGYVVQEASFPMGMAEPTEGALGDVEADVYPHLREMAAAAARPESDYADAFEFGLDLILDALDRLPRA